MYVSRTPAHGPIMPVLAVYRYRFTSVTYCTSGAMELGQQRDAATTDAQRVQALSQITTSPIAQLQANEIPRRQRKCISYRSITWNLIRVKPRYPRS
jgi:hypothetical protein